MSRSGTERRRRVRLRPLGGNDYDVAVDGVNVATAHFARFRTGEGMSAEAWVEWRDGCLDRLPVAYFADFVREVRRIFAPPPF